MLCGWQSSNAKLRHYPINYLQEDDAKEGTKGDVQPREGFPPEIDAIALVDNLIVPVFVLFKRLKGKYSWLQ